LFSINEIRSDVLIRVNDFVTSHWRRISFFIKLDSSSNKPEHAEGIVSGVKRVKGVAVESVSDETFLMHLGGKLEIASKVPLKTRADLPMA